MSCSHGAAAVGELLHRASNVEAVFAVSDLSAVGVIMEWKRRGISVPGDNSVIGFDDFEIGREINPALTTIRVDFAALGGRAGRMILEVLGGGEQPSSRVVPGVRGQDGATRYQPEGTHRQRAKGSGNRSGFGAGAPGAAAADLARG